MSNQPQSRRLAFRPSATLITVAAVAFAVMFTLVAAPASAESHMTWSWGSGKTIRGSGNVVERPVVVAAFDQVVAQDGIRVVLRRGASQSVLVKTDDNLVPLVEAKVDGARLLLRVQPKTSATTKNGVVVTLDYTALSSLSLSDGARGELDAASGSAFRATVKDGAVLNIAEASANDFELAVRDGASAKVTKATSVASQRYKVADGARLAVDAATGERLSISVADGASASLSSVNIKMIDASVSDGAQLEVAGVAQQQNFALADGAAINAVRLEGSSARVRAIDGGALKLGIVQTLSAETADGGSVRYSGDPTVTVSSRGGGSIRKI
jgi:Putative auto-transporter adhesin, head GIN domain